MVGGAFPCDTCCASVSDTYCDDAEMVAYMCEISVASVVKDEW